MASTVCGMTPSSAATTSTTMSVTFAPRARMRVNASWPGVSMKTILRAVLLDVVRADVLRDSAGFALGHVGDADGVEQRRLAVIDVAHDGDHRRTRLRDPAPPSAVSMSCMRLFFVADLWTWKRRIRAQIPSASFDVQSLVDGGEDLAVHQLLDDQLALTSELFGKLFDGDAFRDRDLAIDCRRARRLLAAPCMAGVDLLSSLSRSRSMTRPRAVLVSPPDRSVVGAMAGSGRSGEVGCMAAAASRSLQGPPGPPGTLGPVHCARMGCAGADGPCIDWLAGTGSAGAPDRGRWLGWPGMASWFVLELRAPGPDAAERWAVRRAGRPDVGRERCCGWRTLLRAGDGCARCSPGALGG